MKRRFRGHLLVTGVLVLAFIIAGCQIFPSYAPFNVRVSVTDPSGQGSTAPRSSCGVRTRSTRLKPTTASP